MRVPIRARLTLAYGAVFVLVIALLEIGTYASVRAAVHSIVDRELETRLAGLDDHLSRHISRYAWPELANSLKEHPAFQPAFLRISSAGGAPLFEGASMQDAAAVNYAETPQLITLNSRDHGLRVLVVRRLIQGNFYDLALATDLLIPGMILQRLWLVMLLLIPAVIIAASWMGYWISGQALVPVSEIIAAARSIDSTRLNQRIGVPNTGDEIQQLAETTNGMLDRIEHGFRHVREFTANASHELRTPITIIRGAAEVALLTQAPSEQTYRDALGRILREAERNSKLLEDLLHLSRADSGAERVNQEPLDLVRSVSQAYADSLELPEARGLDLTFLPPVDHPWIVGDEDQLRRLWRILLDNALKYTPQGGRVAVSLGMTADARPFFEVRDNGIGIGPDHLPQIFERFYRADKSRTRRYGGSGLGLAIAREIAILHDATIDVESHVGTGSVFRVTFPCRLENSASAPALRSAS